MSAVEELTTRARGGAAARRPSLRADREAALLLRVLLEESRYAQIQGLLRANALDSPFVEPFSGEWVRQAVEDLGPLQQLMVRLFTLGSAVAPEEARACLDDAVVARLAEAGVLEVDGERVRSRFIAIAYLNRFFLVSPPLWLRGYEPGETVVYAGPDSYWMARFAANLGPVERALDLCTGSGLLGSLLDARRTVAVEIDPDVAEAARFNAILNGLDERIEVRAGDLYEAVPGERFDLIVANPPFLPAPDGLALPSCGDGGSDGGEALRAILSGLGERLSFGGRALIYGQGFGDEREPAIAGWLREALAGTDLGGALLIGDLQSLESAGLSLRQLWEAGGATEEEAFAAWNRFCEDPDLVRHFTFLIDLGHGGEGELEVQRLLSV